MKRAYFKTVEAARRCRDMAESCGYRYEYQESGFIPGKGYRVMWAIW